MFDLSVEKLFILAIVALFVLGPERLPIAAAGWRERCGRSRISPTMRTRNSVANWARNSTSYAPH